MYIEKINSPKDIKKFQIKELTELAGEVREAIINKVSDCGGHLASNLGMVELTIALHYVFDSPKDKFVFDVSHQTYCHKILTGRKDAFIEKESYQNVTGFICCRAYFYLNQSGMWSGKGTGFKAGNRKCDSHNRGCISGWWRSV